MSQFIHIRRVGAQQPGWFQDVQDVPRVGDFLSFGCAHGEQQTTYESNILSHQKLWVVTAVIHHYLCDVESNDDPKAASTIEILVEPHA